jgi:hypothetical protein
MNKNAPKKEKNMTAIAYARSIEEKDLEDMEKRLVEALATLRIRRKDRLVMWKELIQGLESAQEAIDKIEKCKPDNKERKISRILRKLLGMVSLRVPVENMVKECEEHGGSLRDMVKECKEDCERMNKKYMDMQIYYAEVLGYVASRLGYSELSVEDSKIIGDKEVVNLVNACLQLANGLGLDRLGKEM